LAVDATLAFKSSADTKVASAELAVIEEQMLSSPASQATTGAASDSGNFDGGGGGGGGGLSEVQQKTLEAAQEKKRAAENNGVVNFVGDSLGKDRGHFGMGALADDGFICEYAGGGVEVEVGVGKSWIVKGEKEGCGDGFIILP
jgi:hypothetical protein